MPIWYRKHWRLHSLHMVPYDYCFSSPLKFQIVSTYNRRNGFANICDQALQEHRAPFHNHRVATTWIKMSGFRTIATRDAKFGRIQRSDGDGLFEHGWSLDDG